VRFPGATRLCAHQVPRQASRPHQRGDIESLESAIGAVETRPEGLNKHQKIETVSARIIAHSMYRLVGEGLGIMRARLHHVLIGVAAVAATLGALAGPAQAAPARSTAKPAAQGGLEVAIQVGRRARCSWVDGVSACGVFGSLDAAAAGLVA
jgi:hypothetical protein